MGKSDVEDDFNELLMALNARLIFALARRERVDNDDNEESWEVISTTSGRLPLPKARHTMAALGGCPKAD